MPNLLKPDGSFDRAAIMSLAADMARRTVANPLPGFTRKTYRQALPACLSQAWKNAKSQQADARKTDDEKAADAHVASLLFSAAMIDETARSFADRDAILSSFRRAA